MTVDPLLGEISPPSEPCGLAWAPILVIWFGCAAISVGIVLAIDHATRRNHACTRT